MQKLYINTWLGKGINELGGNLLMQNTDNELELDFSNVNEIRLNDIERLLALQKIAVFNEVKIKVENMTPAISRIFEQTGLYKMLNTFGSPSQIKIHKRLGLVAD